MPSWPVTLPAPLLAGYVISPTDESVRTDMDVGYARARRRTVQVKDSVTAVWTLSDADFASFRTWFEDGVNGGAGGSGWFSMAWDNGMGATSARFIGTFKAERLDGPFWRVTATLEYR